MHNEDPLFLILKGTCKTPSDNIPVYTPSECRSKIDSVDRFSISKEESVIILFKNAEKSYIEWIYIDYKTKKKIDETSIIRMNFIKAKDDWYCIYLDLDTIMKYSNDIYSKNSKRIYVSFSIKDEENKEKCDFSVWFKKTTGVEKKNESKTEKIRIKSEDSDENSSGSTKKNKRENPFKDNNNSKKQKQDESPPHNLPQYVPCASNYSYNSDESIDRGACDNADEYNHSIQLKKGINSWESFVHYLINDMNARIRIKLKDVSVYAEAYCAQCGDPNFLNNIYAPHLIGAINEVSQETNKKIVDHLIRSSDYLSN